MKTRLIILALAIPVLLCACSSNNSQQVNQWAIALHGGAGAMTPENYTPEQIAEYEQELHAALSIGTEILKSGGTSMDAVEQVVRYLEDCPLFNAGKGAVFTNDGKNELDAAIMCGKTLNAGAVAGVGDIKNPVTAARTIMEKSPHVLMIGKGASLFASLQGIEIVDSSYFYTEERYKALQRIVDGEKKRGTVGCVALDLHGNLAAATSTGGMTNKRYGRVGDVPIIGAGTYANNNTCAISATGHGESIIRYTAAHDISALMEYKGYTLEQATFEVVQRKMKDAKGEIGVVAVDKRGNVQFSFNSLGMFRACASENGDTQVAIF